MKNEVPPALLTNTELEWLRGNKQVSKSFEWKMKSEIRRKLRTFESLELPLLQSHGFDLTINSMSLTTNSKEADDSNLSYIASSVELARARRLVRTGC